MVEAAANDPTFEPKPVLLTNLENALTENVDFNKRVCGDNAVGGKFDEYFSCMICLMVVEEPQECLECNQLTCKECLDGWQAKGEQTCPGCRGSLNINSKLNRFVKQSLDNIELNCDSCSGQFKYENRRQHWEKCLVKYVCQVEGCIPPHGQA